MAAAQRSSCFATATAADLVSARGAKRIGSAQLWRSGCLLQHGSILLNPPSELWELVFGAPPPRLPSLPLEASDLEILLTDIALASLPTAETGSSLCPLDAAELARIAACRSRYGVEIQG